MGAVRTLLAEKPGLVSRIASRLLRSKPAPTSRMKLRETWTRIRLERIQAFPRPPTTPPDSDFIAPARSMRLAWMAGTRPKSLELKRVADKSAVESLRSDADDGVRDPVERRR